MGNILLLFLVLFPMLLSAWVFPLRRRDRRYRNWLIQIIPAVELAAALLLLLWPGAALELPGVFGFGLRLQAGSLGSLLALVSAFLWAATGLNCPSYFAAAEGCNRFYFFWLLTLGALMGVFLAADLFTLFVFFEMMSFTSYVWVVQNETEEARQAGQTYLAVAVIGGMALLAGLLALWELSCRMGLSDGFLTSCPSRMAATFASLCRSGDLWRHIGVSCGETVIGFLSGTAMGTVVAICMWWWDGVARVLNPYLVVLNALPKTALGPIFIVWMGAGMGSIIVMTLAISLIVTILSMYQGFLGTDGEKLRLMRSLGATRGQILWMLVFPASFPTLFNTLKVNVGLSWVGVIMGEFLVSRAGLGYLIVYGSQVFNMDLVMTSVLILAAAAVVMYRLVLGAEKLLQHYWGVKA